MSSIMCCLLHKSFLEDFEVEFAEEADDDHSSSILNVNSSITAHSFLSRSSFLNI